MKNMSLRDTDQIHRYEHDEVNDARRVTIVGVEGLKESISEALKDSKLELPEIKVQLPEQPFQSPQILKQTEIVEVPKIITEVKVERVEVPVIIKETEIRYVDRPVITETVRFVEHEKTLVVTDYKNLPRWVFLSQSVFITLNLGLLLFLILK